MLSPRKDSVRPLTLDDAVVNLRVRSPVPHEICEVNSALDTRLVDDVIGMPAGS